MVQAACALLGGGAPAFACAESSDWQSARSSDYQSLVLGLAPESSDSGGITSGSAAGGQLLLLSGSGFSTRIYDTDDDGDGLPDSSALGHGGASGRVRLVPRADSQVAVGDGGMVKDLTVDGNEVRIGTAPCRMIGATSGGLLCITQPPRDNGAVAALMESAPVGLWRFHDCGVSHEIRGLAQFDDELALAHQHTAASKAIGRVGGSSTTGVGGSLEKKVGAKCGSCRLGCPTAGSSSGSGRGGTIHYYYGGSGVRDSNPRGGILLQERGVSADLGFGASDVSVSFDGGSFARVMQASTLAQDSNPTAPLSLVGSDPFGALLALESNNGSVPHPKTNFETAELVNMAKLLKGVGHQATNATAEAARDASVSRWVNTGAEPRYPDVCASWLARNGSFSAQAWVKPRHFNATMDAKLAQELVNASERLIASAGQSSSASGVGAIVDAAESAALAAGDAN